MTSWHTVLTIPVPWYPHTLPQYRASHRPRVAPFAVSVPRIACVDSTIRGISTGHGVVRA
eukprot:2030183-Rhodomonas_salina.1